MSDTSAAIPLAQCALSNPLGAYISNVVGAAVSCALWGAGCMQTFLYFMNYESDHLLLKTVVAALWLMDTSVEFLSFAGIFPLMATPTSLLTKSIPAGLVIRVLIEAVMGLVVQLFFLHRIYLFSEGSRVVRAFLALTMLITTWQLVGSAIWTAWSLREDVPVSVFWQIHRDGSVAVSLRAVSAFVDVLIATWMSVLLQKKRHMVFRRTDRLLYRLTIMTINTGLWTAMLAVVDFSLLAWRPTNLVFAAFEYPLGALYFNTLLANLNARKYMRGVACFTDPPSDLPAAAAGAIPLGRMSLSLKFAAPRSESWSTPSADEESFPRGVPCGLPPGFPDGDVAVPLSAPGSGTSSNSGGSPCGLKGREM